MFKETSDHSAVCLELYCWNFTQHRWKQSPFLPCNSYNSSYICKLSWQQASLIIDGRMTKIEQNLHLCALLYSDQRTKWSINPVMAVNPEAGNAWTVARTDLQRSQRSAGIPCQWGWGGGGWFVWDSALPRLLLADLRPSQLPASSLLSVRLPAATHADTSHYLLMAFPGSSWHHSHYWWAGGPLQRL